MLNYPYHATDDRRERILSNWRSVKPGMSSGEVEALLGDPDEVNKTYEPQMYKPAETGKSYVYLIERLEANGSVKSMKEILIRIHMDQSGRVKNIIPVGLAQLPSSLPSPYTPSSSVSSEGELKRGRTGREIGKSGREIREIGSRKGDQNQEKVSG